MKNMDEGGEGKENRLRFRMCISIAGAQSAAGGSEIYTRNQ